MAQKKQMCYGQCQAVGTGMNLKLLGDVHIKGHQRANYGEPPPIPEGPVLRIIRVIGAIPGY